MVGTGASAKVRTAMPETGLPYKILNQAKPANVCDAEDVGYLASVWSEVDDLYRGGYAIEAHAKRYLPALVGEHPTRHADRLRAAGYINYFGQTVDYFKSALFADDVTVIEAADAKDKTTPGDPVSDRVFYDTFAKNVDLRGTSLSKLLQECFVTAAKKRKALVAIDFPRGPEDERPVTRAEEDEMGLARAYAFEVPVEQLIDWEYDENDSSTVKVGNVEVCVYGFSLAVLKKVVSRRRSVTDSRDQVVEEFRVWSRDPNGKIRWDLYRTASHSSKEPPRDDDVIPWVDGDVTKFKRIPILELTVTDGLWIGNTIGPLAREHYQRRTTLVSAEYRSLVAIPVAALGPEVSGIGEAMPSEAQQNPQRGDDPVAEFRARGYVVTGSQDKIYFAEPSGSANKLVSDELKDLRDEIHRVVHQMANSISNSSVGRSGDSKREDRTAERVVLTGYGALMRDFVRRIYETISTARNEDVAWEVHGLDDFEAEDRETLLSEAVQVDSISIPSPTFKRAYKLRLALGLLGSVDAATQKTIKDEIDKGVTDEEVMRPTPADPNEPDGDEYADGDADERNPDDQPRSAKPPRGVGPEANAP